MIVFNSLDEITGISGTVIALGNFDGVHLGHQELIGRGVKAARESGLKSAIFAFSNHPKDIVTGEKVRNILYQDEKISVIKDKGIDYMFNIPFDEDIQEMGAVEFIDKLLLAKLRMKTACCGFNYRFGRGASGNAEVLKKEGEGKRFGVHVIEPVTVNGELVNSSRIRELIESGDVSGAAEFIGRHYAVNGNVIIGNKIGRTIGFPTSNLACDESMVSPASGVYITYCIYNGNKYPGVTNVGVKPTLGEFSKNMETHIFDFNKELYGKTIRVEFLKKIRNEKKFGSIDELTWQIKKDCDMAIEWHKKSREG